MGCKVLFNPLMTLEGTGQVNSLPLKDEGAENRGGENIEPDHCTSFLPDKPHHRVLSAAAEGV